MTVRRVARWIALGGLAVAVALTVAHRDAIDGPAVQARLDGLGAWAAPAFVFVYALGALLFLPGSVMTLAGGAVFGPADGALLSLTGATAGATVAFLIARSAGSAWVRRRLGGRLGRLVRGVEDDGWRFVAFVRLVPLFPYNALNYGLGLTRIPLSVYVVATAVCMAPGAAAYSYLGYAGREALQGTRTAIQAGIAGLALVATVVFLLPRVAKRLRAIRRISVSELRALFDSGTRFAIVDVRGRDEHCRAPGHIPGAACIPVDELPDRLREIPAFDDGPLIVVCKTDKRSTAAARMLTANGLSAVHVLVGGVDAWHRDRNPMELCLPEETSS